MIDELLTSRYARALEGSRERVDRRLAKGRRLAVVRLEIGGDDGHWKPLGEKGADVDEAVAIFGVVDLRYLGAGERIIQLIADDQTEQLAFQGHLQRIAKGLGRDYRMIAV